MASPWNHGEEFAPAHEFRVFNFILRDLIMGNKMD
jgi:hypothetical protein